MEEQVRHALEHSGRDAEAARQWLENNLGAATPNLDYFETVRADAAAAKEAWRAAVKLIGIQNLPANEAEAMIAMGELAAYLEDDAKIAVIHQARQEHSARNPRPFMGFGKE